MRSIARLISITLIVAVFSVLSPVASAQQAAQGQVPLTGSVGTHDPTLFTDGTFYYVTATGGELLRAPTLGGPWTGIGTVSKAPWTFAVSVGGLWAPHVVKVGDTFYMYYAQSNFGTNNSAIGVKTTKTPGIAASWLDLGRAIIRSGTYDPGRATYNAIDPAVHQDENGDWWIVWGSHFDGIMIQRLLPDMVTTTGPITMVAHRGSEQFPVTNPNFNRIEGPVIFKHGQYYYLITAWDWCCRGNGNDNTYKVVIGRSASINGPYVDKNGVSLAEGGGSIILNSRVARPGVTPTGLYRAPGGVDIFIENGIYYIVYHAYRPGTTMAIRSMDWHDSWPYFNEPGGGPYDLQDGAYYRLVNQAGIISNPNSLQNPVASNRCLTVAESGGGLDAIQAQCGTSAEQVWKLERKSDGFYRLRSLIDGQSSCLAMANSSGAIGTNVLVTPCGESNTLQQWYFDDTGHGFHRPVVKDANLALEVENVNGVVGTNVVGGYRRDGDHQAGNLTQAAKWPPQQWQLSMVNGPVIVGTPPNQTAEATGPDGASVAYAAPTATDAVDGSRPVSCEPASGATFPLGTTTVTCSASDTQGNSASTTFTVTVVDTTPPAITVPAGITADATSPTGATVTFSTSATDLVDGSRPVSCTPASGATFPIGTTIVTCSASDSRGNADSRTFTVSVKGASAQLDDQKALVQGMANVAEDIKASLIDKLTAIQAKVNGDQTNIACNQLSSYVNQLTALQGKQLTHDQANLLIANAHRISAVLSCT